MVLDVWLVICGVTLPLSLSLVPLDVLPHFGVWFVLDVPIEEVAVLLKKAEQQLGLVRRQSIVNSLYASYDHALTDPASRLSKSLS